MARRGRKRRSSRNFAVIPDKASISLSTLADDTVLKQDSNITLEQDFDVIAMDYIASLRGLTGGEGPIIFGVCDAELSVTEIKECLDAVPKHSNDIPAVEHARRKVRQCGVFSGQSTDDVFNNGNPKRVKLFVQVPAGKNLPNFWAYNRSGAALTTGAVIPITVKYYGRWKT